MASIPITAAEMAAAPRLDFSPAWANAVGWDMASIYAVNSSFAATFDTFVMKFYEGAKYDLYSVSSLDPANFRIQSSAGVILSDPYVSEETVGSDAIFNFIAPYTGDYYVSAGWTQAVGLYDVSLSVFADLDTANIDTPYGPVNRADDDPLVDRAYYLGQYDDIRVSFTDPVAHYHQVGWLEGRNPNAWFSTRDYLDANPDVKAAGIDPLLHFQTIGWKEGRDPSLAFDVEYYLTHNPDVRAAGLNPLSHWVDYGRAEGRSISDLSIGRVNGIGFDAQTYLMVNGDVAAAGLDAFLHYQIYGWREGRDPNAFFDTKGYLATYADVAAIGVDPLLHYMAYGWKEGRDPSAGFDTNAYLAANPDVAAAGLNPFLHFLLYGHAEGRAAQGDGVWG